eukprot:CAMPEP_0194539402 /NCGR_PEP_ID=MMETSP0253-20130528/79359_1 /TAXON_ID=2966 /ORGANISM="Noctiluca scintillans" /LENGTH=30 /DNA_ID= /DNA_START= /DNA_END= /DNA_ORIENTATION=
MTAIKKYAEMSMTLPADWVTCDAPARLEEL